VDGGILTGRIEAMILILISGDGGLLYQNEAFLKRSIDILPIGS